MDDDFLPDEFVLDDLPEPEHGPTVVFAGPSDPPPVLHAPRAAATRTARARGPYVFIAVAVCAAMATVAAITGTERSPRPRIAGAPPAAKEDMPLSSPAVSDAPVVEPPSASAPPDGAGLAELAMRAAQSALEKGHTVAAIEAGERAVAIDPTDAEAWLILGAAYDQRGAYAQARRCFERCVHVATRGPRGECAALLR